MLAGGAGLLPALQPSTPCDVAAPEQPLTGWSASGLTLARRFVPARRGGRETKFKAAKDPLVVFPKSLIKDYEFLRTTPEGLTKRTAIWAEFKGVILGHGRGKRFDLLEREGGVVTLDRA